MRRIWLSLLVCVSAAVYAASACTPFSSVSTPDEPDGSLADGALPDAGAPRDDRDAASANDGAPDGTIGVVDSGPGSPTGVLVDEADPNPCVGWVDKGANVAGTTATHAGAPVCVVCANTSSGYARKTFTVQPAQLGKYKLSLYWQSHADSGVGDQFSPGLRFFDDAGNTVDNHAPSLPITQMWQQTSFTVMTGTTGVTGEVDLEVITNGDCVDVANIGVAK